MKEKDFKQIITSFDAYSPNKKTVDNLVNSLIEKLNKKPLQISDYKYSSWYLVQVYDEADVNIFLNLNLINNINEIYAKKYLFNTLENFLIENDISDLNRTINGFTFKNQDVNYNLNIVSFYEAASFQKILNDYSTKYSLLLNTFKIIKELINQESIKAIDPIVLFGLLENVLKNNDNVENKYYCYLELLIKALDEFVNNRKYTINYLDSNVVLNDFLSEAVISEYKKLRKVLSKATASIEDELKFDSSKEIIIDVNPLKNNNRYEWHYNILGRDMENSGGEYSNTLEDYQTAILKGVFKGLKRVTETPSLINKRIVLKCDYSGILTEVMLSNDENKSRMKTIKQLIETNQLKVTTTI